MLQVNTFNMTDVHFQDICTSILWVPIYLHDFPSEGVGRIHTQIRAKKNYLILFTIVSPSVLLCLVPNVLSDCTDQLHVY